MKSKYSKIMMEFVALYFLWHLRLQKENNIQEALIYGRLEL
jgi:hypothetical protein